MFVWCKTPWRWSKEDRNMSESLWITCESVFLSTCAFVGVNCQYVCSTLLEIRTRRTSHIYKAPVGLCMPAIEIIRRSDNQTFPFISLLTYPANSIRLMKLKVKFGPEMATLSRPLFFIILYPNTTLLNILKQPQVMNVRRKVKKLHKEEIRILLKSTRAEILKVFARCC